MPTEEPEGRVEPEAQGRGWHRLHGRPAGGSSRLTLGQGSQGRGREGGPSCGRGEGAERLCLDCVDAWSARQPSSRSVPTGVCWEPEGPTSALPPHDRA